MICYCHMMTWIGSSVESAEHYYAWMQLGKDLGSRQDLQHILTESGAARRNRRKDDGPEWRAGLKTARFQSEEHLKKEAIKQYKVIFPSATVLVYGESCVFEPQAILDGPEEMKAAINELVDRAESIGWWEGDEEAMEVICDEWAELWEEVG